jgi:hypothetical protein
MKVAVIMAGLLGGYQVAIDPIMENLVLPNNADVFILTARRNYIHASSEDDFTPYNWDSSICSIDEDCIKRCFGKHLRYFTYSEDLLGYQEELDKQKIALKERLSEFSKKDIYFNQDSGTVHNETTYLDQFLRSKYLMTQVSDYDLVIRIRIDQVLTRPLILQPVEDNTLYWSGVEAYLFWGNQETMKRVCNGFLNDIGTYRSPKYLGSKHGLSSDGQFYGFLKKEGINTVHSGVRVGWRLHKRDSICNIFKIDKTEQEIKTAKIAQKDYYLFEPSRVPYVPTFDTKHNILWSYMLY